MKKPLTEQEIQQAFLDAPPYEWTDEDGVVHRFDEKIMQLVLNSSRVNSMFHSLPDEDEGK